MLARFEAERQALALMDHPNIAKVLDAGATREGRPYFVMELVEGPPLTGYCDAKRLTLRERLDLFVRVCQAVQHAHHKGVIHRDLKPSNILVAEVDGKPVPKVIDFGVAKATAERLTEKTLFTAVGTVVGTPEYMSPEQAEPGQMDVDTRSDVYSLGVVLYELLTGSTPLAPERIRTVSLLEVLRLIREEEPPKPSSRLIADGLPDIAANRGLEPRQLAALVRGELDWIVMKALEKDRGRRYESANSLSLDIQRYLRDEPVLACPPSAGYRLRKLARRHRRAFLTAGVLALAVILTVGALGWMARDRAVRRARLGDEVTRSLEDTESLFQRGKLPEALAEVRRGAGLAERGDIDGGLDSRVRQWRTDLEMAARLQSVRLERDAIKDNNFDMAKSDPEYRAAFCDYGLDLVSLEPSVAAERIRASAIREELIAALDDWAFANAEAKLPGSERWQQVARLADTDTWRGRFRAAFDPVDRPTLVRLAHDPDVLAQPPATTLLLGRLLARAKEPRLAIEVLHQAQQRFPGDFWANYDLAIELLAQKPPRASDAVGYLRTALAIRPDSVGVHRSLGIALFEYSKLTADTAARLKPEEIFADYTAHPTAFHRERLAEAEASCRNAVRLKPDFADAQNNLGLIHYYQGRHREAEAAFREAIRLKPDYTIAYDNLGLALKEQNRYAEAADACR
ncbi:MAG TPA: protein kinase, partial [Gemmataceae bacterium]|nr:protein kinase [Gemmataceae bacterium]